MLNLICPILDLETPRVQTYKQLRKSIKESPEFFSDIGNDMAKSLYSLKPFRITFKHHVMKPPERQGVAYTSPTPLDCHLTSCSLQISIADIDTDS